MIELPIRLESESNARGHWSAKHRRATCQRGVVVLALRTSKEPRALPCVVQLVRVAPRALDDDKLRGALKAVRDGVADVLGVEDNDPRITWEYAQAKPDRARHYAVRVSILPALVVT